MAFALSTRDLLTILKYVITPLLCCTRHSDTLSCRLRNLAEANVSSATLESLAASLRSYFAKADYFRVGNALVGESQCDLTLWVYLPSPSPQTMLLQHKDLLPLPSQRLAAMFLLYELYRSDQPSANPFAQFFVELLQLNVEDDRTVAGMACGHALSVVEKWFLAQLLSSSAPKDVSQCLLISSCCTLSSLSLLSLSLLSLSSPAVQEDSSCHSQH